MLIFSLFPGFLSGIMGQGDSTDLQYPFREDPNAAFSDAGEISPLYLNNPSNIQSEIVYDPETHSYVFSEKIGSFNYRPSKVMSFDEYRNFEMSQAKKRYWEQRRAGGNLETQASFIPTINVGGEAFDRVFGTNTINIIPQGYAELIFGFNMSRIDNPTLTEKLRKTPSFTFEEKIQMNVTGTIGDKMKLGVNYNTETTFEFENKTKLEYSGKEDRLEQSRKTLLDVLTLNPDNKDAANLLEEVEHSLVQTKQTLPGCDRSQSWAQAGVQIG